MPVALPAGPALLRRAAPVAGFDAPGPAATGPADAARSRVDVIQLNGPRHSGTDGQFRGSLPVRHQGQVQFARFQLARPDRPRRSTAHRPAPPDAFRRSAAGPRRYATAHNRPACRAGPCRQSPAPERGHHLVVQRQDLPRRGPADSGRAASGSTPPPLPRLSTVWPRLSSSRLICIETADCVRPSRSAALGEACALRDELEGAQKFRVEPFRKVHWYQYI